MSDLAGFTPGPWRTTDLGGLQGHVFVEQTDSNGLAGLVVADCHRLDEGEANAKLIALAPTMYAELSRLRTALEEILKLADFDDRPRIKKVAREALRPALEKTDGTPK